MFVSYRTVEILLKYGADASKMEKQGFLPIHYASVNGHKLTIEMVRRATNSENYKFYFLLTFCGTTNCLYKKSNIHELFCFSILWYNLDGGSSKLSNRIKYVIAICLNLKGYDEDIEEIFFHIGTK